MKTTLKREKTTTATAPKTRKEHAMPWRLIAFLIALTIVVLFAGFNSSNTSNISFAFYTAKNVPVYVSLFIAFLLGAFTVMPFAFRKRSAKGTQKKSREVKQNAPETLPAEEKLVPQEQPEEAPKKKRDKK